jgi:UDP-glucose 4-epimerase
VKRVVLSTDKAVYPINTMGLTKALMEKLAISKARDSKVIKMVVLFARQDMVM